MRQKYRLKLPAFTLIELLVVIAIIGLLTTIAVISLNNARAKARDAKRVSDIKQVQTALELFFNDKGRYPTETELNSGSMFSTSTNGTTTYMTALPIAPNPPDGICATNQNNFIYYSTPDGSSYTINYCVGGNTGSLTAGSHCATPNGISTGEDCGLGVIIGCVASSWSPDPASECQGTFTQTSNCNDTRLATGIRVDSVWTPDSSSVCSGESFIQTGDCGGSQDSLGTLTCPNGYNCAGGSCHINQYTLTYTAGANGSITGTSPQTINYGSNGSTVTAVPNSGAYFVNWSDSLTANPRTDINVTGNISVTANFALICPDSSISYGGESYPTVTIGNQCWLAKNLNFGTRVNGSQDQGNYSSGAQKYCYSDNIANCTTDGGLYQWHMAMGLDQACDNHNGTSPCIISSPQQGICPTGWHVPDNAEWVTLTSYLATHGHSGVEGTALKASATSTPIAWNGTNNYNFSALPAGFRLSSLAFYDRGNGAYIWSTLAQSDANAWGRNLAAGSGVVNYYDPKNHGWSVRCVKN